MTNMLFLEVYNKKKNNDCYEADVKYPLFQSSNKKQNNKKNYHSVYTTNWILRELNR